MYPSPGPQGPSPAVPDLPPFDPNDHYQEFVPKPAPPPHGRLWVQLVLFAVTVLTTTTIGSLHYLGYTIPFDRAKELLDGDRSWLTAQTSQPIFYVRGLWYSFTILAILGCHEMGHYIACLRYNVIATRPFFLPLPPIDPFLTGTLGAFIRIKSRIPNKIALFDIGVAGPIAGFVVAVPALFIGLMMSRVDPVPSDMVGLSLGEPLLFQLAERMIFGEIADGYGINMHPMAFGAWFGMLATALNLFPISQLDGGHISYAVFGRRSVILTFAMIAVAIGLTVVSLSWILWTILMLVMIGLVGPHHPPTLDDEVPLGRGRLLVAAIALLILAVCFTPEPLGVLEMGQ